MKRIVRFHLLFLALLSLPGLAHAQGTGFTYNGRLNYNVGTVVKSLNGLRDDLTLAAGANLTITPNGNTLTLAAAGAGGSGTWSVLNNNAYYTNGNVGIGTTTPANKLTVAAAGYGIEQT